MDLLYTLSLLECSANIEIKLSSKFAKLTILLKLNSVLCHLLNVKKEYNITTCT